MTPTEMVALVQSRTKHPSASKVTAELQGAYRWALRRLFNTENGPDLLVTIGEELTISGRTQTLDLVAELENQFLGIKQLWLKLPTDVNFTPMVPADTTTLGYIVADSEVSTSTQVATGHPVFYDSINFGSVRFAPALPNASKVRVDYYRLGVALDTDESDSESGGPEVPRTLEIIEDAVMDKTTSIVFGLLDDDRELIWNARAESNLRDAIWVLSRRVQGPVQTRPWRSGRLRIF